MTLRISSTAFSDGQKIPVAHSGDGADTSPPLAWSDAPAGTVSWALICEDPDAPRGTYTHWVLFNLPAETHQLPGGVSHDATLADGARHGTNDFGKLGYGGPAPPAGKPHRYFFKLYALDTLLEKLPSGASRSELLAAIEGHVLAEAHVMGTYQR